METIEAYFVFVIMFEKSNLLWFVLLTIYVQYTYNYEVLSMQLFQDAWRKNKMSWHTPGLKYPKLYEKNNSSGWNLKKKDLKNKRKHAFNQKK